MKGSESSFLVRIWEVNGHISSWRDYIKLGIKDIDSMNNSVKTRKGESCVALVLPNFVFAAQKKAKQTSNNNSGRQCMHLNYWMTYYLPAISWYVLVMMKSALFMAIRSAVN